MYVNCKQRGYGRTVSTLVKLSKKEKWASLTLYNAEQLVIKGKLDVYVKKYRQKLSKKSHVKNPGVHKPKLIASVRSFLMYSLKQMGLNKKEIKVNILENNVDIPSNTSVLNLPLVQMPVIHAFSLKELINEL